MRVKFRIDSEKEYEGIVVQMYNDYYTEVIYKIKYDIDGNTFYAYKDSNSCERIED